MAGSTSKKVLVERFDREPLPGFVSYNTFAQPLGVEVLSTAGNASVIPYLDVKAVHFVKDFEGGMVEADRRQFVTRPKSAGLWIRMTFRDDAVLEAILPNDLLRLENYGFTVIPPNHAGNSQRIFVPRQALKDLQVLGVVGGPRREAKTRKPGADKDRDQIGLFE